MPMIKTVVASSTRLAVGLIALRLGITESQVYGLILDWFVDPDTPADYWVELVEQSLKNRGGDVKARRDPQ